MRIFGFGNYEYVFNDTHAERFYPQCGFLALGTPLVQANAAWVVWFLSAMRIFGFGNSLDCLMFVAIATSFYPQCGFLALGTRRGERLIVTGKVSIRNADFWLWERTGTICCHACQFWFLSAMRIFGFGNPRRILAIGLDTWRFLSAMRIFGFGNDV